MATPWDYKGIENVLMSAPHRETQITTLLNLFGNTSDISCPGIFIYGHTGTGKSYLTKTLMESLKVWVDSLYLNIQKNDHIYKSQL